MLRALFVCGKNQDNRAIETEIRAMSSRKFEFVAAEDKENAVERLSEDGPFHLVILDVGHEEVEPAEFGSLCLDFSEDIQILFVGNAEALEHKTKPELEEDVLQQSGFLAFPFEGEQLEDMLLEYVVKHKRAQESAALIEAEESDFAPIKLRSLYLFKTLPADAYLKLSPTKFMKVIDKDSRITQALIQSFAKRKVKNIYLHKSDQVQVLEDAILELYIYLDKYKDTKSILENLIRAAGVVHTYLRDIGTGEAVLSIMDKIIEKCDKVCEDEDSLLALLRQFPLSSGDAAEKSVLCALFGCCVLKKLGYKSSATKGKLILSSLICDSTLENDDLCKINSHSDPNLRMFSEEEQEEFKKHPMREGELASLFTKYPEVDFILEQHHEQPDGSGFPAGIRGKKITLISAIFILSNELASFIIQRGLNRKVLDKGIEVYGEKFASMPFKDPFQKLKDELRAKS